MPLSKQQTGTGWRAPGCVSCNGFTTSALCGRGCHLLSRLLNYFRHGKWLSRQGSEDSTEDNHLTLSSVQSPIDRLLNCYMLELFGTYKNILLVGWLFYIYMEVKAEVRMFFNRNFLWRSSTSYVSLMAAVWRDVGLIYGGLWLCHHPAEPNPFPLHGLLAPN